MRYHFAKQPCRLRHCWSTASAVREGRRGHPLHRRIGMRLVLMGLEKAPPKGCASLLSCCSMYHQVSLLLGKVLRDAGQVGDNDTR